VHPDQRNQRGRFLQATGVRQDAYAKAHPLVVEEEKDARLKGLYICPEV
jgi:hypothetical protein